jgi:Domain of unknown function (DUF3883)
MSRKLALKKLKGSDLSFFQAYLIRHPQSKQKAFNLDQRVVERIFFPALTAEVEASPEKRFGVALTFFGPGGAPPHALMRKVLKQHKNWRLNGEAIYNPNESPQRYDILEPEDIAIMEFTGASAPVSIKVVLLAAADPKDAATHAAFTAAFPGESMSELAEETIEEIIATANTPSDHPIRDWLDKYLLEDVGRGDPEAIERLIKKRNGRDVTAAELKKAIASAEKAGSDGEELLDFYFESTAIPELQSYCWVAKVNAVSPFDFLLSLTDGTERHVDAKSTGGPFSNSIHLSMSEIKYAVSSGVGYDIFRLYNVSESGAAFRVARSIGVKLTPVVDVLKRLPNGVKVDSLSFNPDYFDFDEEETVIQYPEESE